MKTVDFIQGVAFIIMAISLSILCVGVTFVMLKDTLDPPETLICPKSCYDKRR